MDSEVNKEVAEVENFIRQLHNMEIILRPQKKDQEICNNINTYITLYELMRSQEYKDRTAGYCLIWIRTAYLRGIIQKGEGFTTINKKYEDEINQLKKQLDECKERCKILEEDNKLLNVLKDKTWLQGDVNP